MTEIYLKVSLVKLPNEHEDIKTEVVRFVGKTMNEKINFYYDSLGIRTFDIVALSSEIDLIVDDEGLFVPGNPVFAFPNKIYNEDLHIVGSFLIGKQILNDELDVETVGFETMEEMGETLLRNNLHFAFIGKVA